MADYPIREIFERFYPLYRASHSVTPEQESAAQCIMGCKTGRYGFTVSTCPECGFQKIHYASCGNRNCPNCQATKAAEWTAERNTELIEGISYFHVVMTVPHELNPLFLSNMKSLCRILMKASSAAILELSKREENLGAVPGIVSVLHTWGSNLELHPHVHLLVSGGGLKNPLSFVTPRNPGFYLPDAQLSGSFRQHFLSMLKELRKNNGLVYEGLSEPLRNSYNWEELLTSLYHTHWNVYLKETFNGNGNAVEYLSRYSYRTAISNSRIMRITGNSVIFKWRDYKDNNTIKELELPGEEFIRRFLIHILPKGFSRIRFSGFLANGHKKKCLGQIHRLRNTQRRMNPLKGKTVYERIRLIFGHDLLCCPECSHPMGVERILRGVIKLE